MASELCFSVVIPVHNRAQQLRSALQSVLKQAEQDFEVIVIDDDSQDDPAAVVSAFADPRIRLLRQQPHNGAGAARNMGIDEARGRFVAFLDSDDRFLPHHLSAMRRLFASQRVDAAYAPVWVERGRGLRFVKPPRAIAPDEHMANYVLSERGFVPTTTLVVERTWAVRVRYDPAVPYAQDTDFSIRLYLAGCRFAMVPEPGGIWSDLGSPLQISTGRKGRFMESWLERLKPEIPERAWFGARGWMIAKGIAAREPLRALMLFADALRHRCYRPELALSVFCQIFLPQRVYRTLADMCIRVADGAVWSRADRSMPRAESPLPRDGAPDGLQRAARRILPHT